MDTSEHTRTPRFHVFPLKFIEKLAITLMISWGPPFQEPPKIGTSLSIASGRLTMFNIISHGNRLFELMVCCWTINDDVQLPNPPLNPRLVMV